MAGWQRCEHSDEIPDLLIVGTNADASAEFLQHIDAGAPVRRIHHEMHRAIGFEYAAQSAEPRIRIREMMKNPGADNLIEVHFQIACPLDGKLVDLKIVYVVLAS